MKTWKHNIAIIILFGILMGVLLMAFDNYAKDVKGLLFFILLAIASYKDIKTRIIPNVIHILIMMVGMIQIDLVDSLLGFVIVPSPFFIMAYLKEGSIGGGDIKIMAAIGFAVGLFKGMEGSLLALILIVLTSLGSKWIYHKEYTCIPVVPFLTIGFSCIFYAMQLV